MEIANLQVEKWYKSKAGNYFKFKELRNNIFYSSEEIINKEWRIPGPGGCLGVCVGLFLWIEELVEVPISEIQKYLPESHVDKIPKQENQIPEYVECIKLPQGWSGTTKVGRIYKTDTTGYAKGTYRILCHDYGGQTTIGVEDHFKPSTKSAYEAQFAKSTLTGSQILNLGDKPVEVPWTVGGWVKVINDPVYKQMNNTYQQIHNQTISDSLVNVKYSDQTRLLYKNSECGWIGMEKPIKCELPVKQWFRGLYNYIQDITIQDNIHIIKKNKGVASVEVLPLQKPCLISTKKKKSKLIFN